MPTYEYHCDACDHDFEEFQSITEASLKKCPQCGRLKLRRVYGAGGAIIFKGSGFYQTDYRSESYKAAAKAEQESSKPASDKASSNGAAETPAPAPRGKTSKGQDKKTSKSDT
jgi:putative FmdB family regulatory protein